MAICSIKTSFSKLKTSIIQLYSDIVIPKFEFEINFKTYITHPYETLFLFHLPLCS